MNLQTSSPFFQHISQYANERFVIVAKLQPFQSANFEKGAGDNHPSSATHVATPSSFTVSF